MAVVRPFGDGFGKHRKLRPHRPARGHAARQIVPDVDDIGAFRRDRCPFDAAQGRARTETVEQIAHGGAAEVDQAELDRPRAAIFVDLQVEGRVNALARLQFFRQIARGEIDRLQGGAVRRAQAQAQVFPAADRADALDGQLAHAEDRLRAARAARLELGKADRVLLGQQVRRHLAVDFQRGSRQTGGGKLLRAAADAAAEFVDIPAPDRKARRELVPAVAL